MSQKNHKLFKKKCHKKYIIVSSIHRQFLYQSSAKFFPLDRTWINQFNKNKKKTWINQHTILYYKFCDWTQVINDTRINCLKKYKFKNLTEIINHYSTEFSIVETSSSKIRGSK